MAYIEIKDYTKIIKDAKILDHVSLSLEKGKIYGFYGRNGCGKSMIFKAICGLIYPTSGEISINDKILFKDMDIPESIGALIDNPGFFPQLSGYENLKLLADINHLISKETILNYLEILHLNNKKKYKHYSLGMKQRLNFIQAVMENPDIIILDEVMNALDEEHVNLVKEIVLKKKLENRCILLASHSKEDLDYLCDEIFHMEEGVIKERMLL